MDPNREKLLKEVMAADFTVIELNLYLNTHPCDQRALSLYNCSVQNARMIREKFERMYGPLTAWNTLNNGYSWRWIEEPWPWQG